ncbi:hypothetical protein [Enterocloster phage PMBT24]|uniref:Uncharacterized protein n=1 Tax=Enterocloster phage PMBT24 TaxID=3025413 RepID=A0AAT9TS35_9CAUD|nr:hypothetical protein [Enterocloster phage PMBT24]
MPPKFWNLKPHSDLSRLWCDSVWLQPHTRHIWPFYILS